MAHTGPAPITYLSSPSNGLKLDAVRGMPVLLSFALFKPGVNDWVGSFGRLLLDSGAYSELNSGKRIDGAAYKDWSAAYPWADAVAGLDDIAGHWQRSLRNYDRYGGFPTMHDTDPPELLDDLIPLARTRGSWLGIGLKPPRQNKERFIRWVCDRVPDDLHIHGWALRGYRSVERIDSFDSTNWFRDALNLKALPLCRHLTHGECLEIVIKRYQREGRTVARQPAEDRQLNLLEPQPQTERTEL